MDCHVHIDEIKIHDLEVANFFNKKTGDVRWKGATIEKHVEHIRKDNLEMIFAIYEDPASLQLLRDAAPSCDVRGMYFIRKPLNPDTEYIRELYQKGYLQGIKVHPVIDSFALTTQNLKPVLSLAKEFNVPVLYHSDDRNKFWHLTSPELQKTIVKENPDITFLIGHGGAYAKPRITGSSPSAVAYWEGNEKIVSRRNLVIQALELSRENNNVFYDLTIATNVTKARIIADFINTHPDSAEKILIGTDFPIGLSKAISQINALAKADMRPNLVQKIASNRI